MMAIVPCSCGEQSMTQLGFCVKCGVDRIGDNQLNMVVHDVERALETNRAIRKAYAEAIQLLKEVHDDEHMGLDNINLWHNIKDFLKDK
jgi:hypothetical protein